MDPVGIMTAIQLTNTAVTLALNVLLSAQRANTMIEKARSEGRDVSSAELADLQQEGDSLLRELRSLGVRAL